MYACRITTHLSSIICLQYRTAFLSTIYGVLISNVHTRAHVYEMRYGLGHVTVSSHYVLVGEQLFAQELACVPLACINDLM